MLLRGHRPEGVDGRPGGGAPARRRGDGVHDGRGRHGRRVRPAQVPRALRGLRDGRVLPLPASTRCASTTTCPSRPTPTARCRCCCGAPRGARPSRATSSTCTPACWSAPASSTTSWAAGRSRRSRSSRPRPATSPRTSRPTSSRSPTARSTSRPSSSSRACGRR